MRQLAIKSLVDIEAQRRSQRLDRMEADKLKGKTRFSVVTNGALTSLPLQVLITKDPSDKPLKDVDWLVRSYAITNLPSVASLKTLRLKSLNSLAHKPMIAFVDPIFSKEEKDQLAALRGE